MYLNIQTAYCTRFKRYGQPRSGPLTSIEVHSIGTAQSSAKSIRDYMDQYNPDGIVHAIVDARTEGKVLEILPDYNVAWADAGYGNQHSFTFEIAESNYMRYQSGGASYQILDQEQFIADIQRGYRTAVAYAAKKCLQFGLDPLAKLSNGLYTVYSHNEGRLAGLSSAHVDPSHIWPKIGKTMDDFRREVAEAMRPSPDLSGDRWYRVRRSWEDKKSQTNAFHSLELAKKDADAHPGYHVFDPDGNKIYSGKKQ